MLTLTDVQSLAAFRRNLILTGSAEGGGRGGEVSVSSAAITLLVGSGRSGVHSGGGVMVTFVLAVVTSGVGVASRAGALSSSAWSDWLGDWGSGMGLSSSSVSWIIVRGGSSSWNTSGSSSLPPSGAWMLASGSDKRE